MYRIRINARFTQYTFKHEHAARLVYGEIIRLAQTERFPANIKPREIALYWENGGEFMQLDQWNKPVPKPKLLQSDNEIVRGCPFPKKLA